MAYEVMRRPKGGGMLIEHSIRDGNTKQAGNKTEKMLEFNRFGKNLKKNLIFSSGRKNSYYRVSLTYANFITANFITF